MNKIPFNRNTVKKWRLKEEWFFDKKRSVMDVRIVGLAPCRYILNQDSTDEVLTPLFWIYYPAFREVLAKTNVLNITKNDAQKRSFLDIFFVP